jgi:hypothetical protein
VGSPCRAYSSDGHSLAVISQIDEGRWHPVMAVSFESPEAGGEIPGENQCTTDLQIRNPKRVQGILPAEGLVVDSPQDEGCPPIP